jgi:ArsR family transcriptional regulator
MTAADRNVRLSNRTLQDLVERFKQLSDPSRLTILVALAGQGEMTVTDLAKLLLHSQPSISQHLKSLLLLGLVQFRRAGKWNYYRLDSAGLAEVVEQGFALAAGGPTLKCHGFSLMFKRTRARLGTGFGLRARR